MGIIIEIFDSINIDLLKIFYTIFPIFLENFLTSFIQQSCSANVSISQVTDRWAHTQDTEWQAFNRNILGTRTLLTPLQAIIAVELIPEVPWLPVTKSQLATRRHPAIACHLRSTQSDLSINQRVKTIGKELDSLFSFKHNAAVVRRHMTFLVHRKHNSEIIQYGNVSSV